MPSSLFNVDCIQVGMQSTYENCIAHLEFVHSTETEMLTVFSLYVADKHIRWLHYEVASCFRITSYVGPVYCLIGRIYATSYARALR